MVAKVTLEVTIEDPRWQAAKLEDLTDEAVQIVLEHFCIADADCEISVLGCDDLRIAELNREFRGKPVPTNVLSWPAQERGVDVAGDRPAVPEPDFTGEIPLGDIAIAFETCEREANEAQKPLADHLRHLIVHGLLHLFGYDHIRDQDATLMESLEIELLGKMGVDNPYMVEDSPVAGRIG
ncbi:rRNA maturation RNase YbeY [Phaeobacter sp.]|uniref:rRNA maturation RNase YbeY n=1 Tax=Phaeobacter sp. TaxID=1902409 RepID=UPI0025EFC6A7|nr:rRNA maturation RNase YbeY [Phaeobacter sp.]